MIEEIDDNRYGNTSIASGSFGEVSIALYRPSSTGTNTSIGGGEAGGSWSYAAVKTIRNAVLASSVEGTSLTSSWEFAAAGAHSGTDAITATTASNSSSAKPPQLSREAFAELAALRSLASGRHPCIVPLLAAYPSQSGLSRGMGLSLAFPYCPSDLSSAIQRRRCNIREGDAGGGMIPDDAVKAIFRDMMSALQYCHEHGVVHGDINPANFMIGSMGRIQLCDFGLATACPSLRQGSEMERSSHQGNDGEKLPSHALCAINYRAPEIFLGEKFAHPSQDIWGAGLILCELLTLRTTFPGRNDIDQLNRIFDILGTPSEKNWPGASSLPDLSKIRFDPRQFQGIEASVPRIGICQHLKEVANATVSLDPLSRISASTCLKMPWFASGQLPPAATSRQVLQLMLPGDLLLSPIIFPEDIESAKRDAVAIAKTRRDVSRRTGQAQRHQQKSSGFTKHHRCRVKCSGLLPALFMASIVFFLSNCSFCEGFQAPTRGGSLPRPLYQSKNCVPSSTLDLSRQDSKSCVSSVSDNRSRRQNAALYARAPVGFDDEYFRRKRMGLTRGRGRGILSNLSVQKILVALNIVFFLLQILSAANYAPILSNILSRSRAGGAVALKGSDLARRIVLGESALTIMGRASTFGQPYIVASSVGAFTMDFAHQTLLSSIQPHRLITSGFLHGSILHLAFNMRYLWSIPSFLEEGLGRLLYLSTYLASVVAGNLAHSSVASSGPAALGLCLGASSGICGLQGLMFIMLNRDRKSVV